MPKTPTGTPNLEPHFEDVQAHYDLSDDFFRLFLDPTQTYSCAYFERDDMTLEEAQLAKIDLSLGKLGLQPGMTLLDVGCGWGATMQPCPREVRRQRRRPDPEPQPAGPRRAAARRAVDSPRSKRVLLQGWEQFDEPVDRIVSIGAFEHFGRDRYDDFFKMAYAALPTDGVMMLHTIVKPSDEEFKERELPVTMTNLRFFKFIMDEIFPGGDLPQVNVVEEHATKAGFEVKLRPAAAVALRAHPGHLVGRARGPQGRGDRDPVPGGLRPVHEVPDRLRGPVPRGLHRRLPVHSRQELAFPAPTAAIASITACGLSRDTNVLASATSISEEFGNSSAIRVPSDGLKHRSR